MARKYTRKTAWKGSKRPAKKNNAAKAKRQLNAFAAAIAQKYQTDESE